MENDAASPPPPPPPPIVAVTARDARFTYLTGRLRSRQITMEEATELFALQQAQLARALAMAQAPPPSPPRRGGEGARGATAPKGPAAAQLSDDQVALALVALGAGAGLLAAILKRSAAAPTVAASPAPK